MNPLAMVTFANREKREAGMTGSIAVAARKWHAPSAGSVTGVEKFPANSAGCGYGRVARRPPRAKR